MASISGPAPNRRGDYSRESSEARARSGGGSGVQWKAAEWKPCRPPKASGKWHPIARMMWKAAIDSGQSHFYQASDWAVLYSLMDDLSNIKFQHARRGDRVPAIALQTFYNALGKLGLTEGDRRQMRIELEFPSEEVEDAQVVAIQEYRRGLEAV